MKTKKHTPFDIANWFINAINRDAGDSITHLKLQKLLYYAQAWSLAINEKPLFDDDFQAWTHGPVIPSVYEHYKVFGYEALPPSEDVIPFSDEDLAVLNEVQRVYGALSARNLEDLTHSEKPWQQTRGDLALEAACSDIISKESMKAFYSNLLYAQEAQ